MYLGAYGLSVKDSSQQRFKRRVAAEARPAALVVAAERDIAKTPPV